MKDYQYEKDPVLQGIPLEIFEKPVAFVYMTRGNDIYHEFVTYLVRQARLFPKFSCALVQNSWRPAVEELFELAHDTSAEFAHIMDTDIGLRYDTTARLMAADKDIVASPLYFYDPASNDLHLNVHYRPDLMREYTPRMPDGGLEEVFATAFGSVLIKKRVLETFRQANEKFCEWSDLIDEQYKTSSPDTIFFLKAREFGFKIFMDWKIPIGTHHKYCRFDSTFAEKFYVQRWFDITFGPDKKAELFGSKEGREQLKSELQRHYASGLIGRSTGSGVATHKPTVEGDEAKASGDGIRQESPNVHDPDGTAAPVATHAGSDD